MVCWMYCTSTHSTDIQYWEVEGGEKGRRRVSLFESLLIASSMVHSILQEPCTSSTLHVKWIGSESRDITLVVGTYRSRCPDCFLAITSRSAMQ